MTTFYFFDAQSDELLLADESNDGKLKLTNLVAHMQEKLATSTREGIVNGEGFLKPKISQIGETHVVTAFCYARGSLGYYNETEVVDSAISTTRIQHTYYIQSQIIITEDYKVILMFNYSVESSAKPKTKAMVEELGLELSSIKFDNNTLLKLKEKYIWDAAKLDRIAKVGDSTKTISYVIDPADDKESEIDELYKNHGQLTLLSFDFKLEGDSDDSVTVKLYGDNHHGMLNDRELDETPWTTEAALNKLLNEIIALYKI